MAPRRTAVLLRRIASFAVLFLTVAELRLDGQEPNPVRILAPNLSARDDIELTRAWRYAPGDGQGRESPTFDGALWTPAPPSMKLPDPSPGGWKGVGWFRRHLIVEPAAQKRVLAIWLDVLGMDVRRALLELHGPAVGDARERII